MPSAPDATAYIVYHEKGWLLLLWSSRCFCRKIETPEAVLAVFIDAYNKYEKFGEFIKNILINVILFGII